MTKRKDIPEPWRSFLQELDELATAETRLDCMGGFVVTQLYGYLRTTADLDVMEIAPREQLLQLVEAGRQGSPLHRKHNVWLDLVGVAKVPDGYEDRLIEMYTGAFRRLRLCALDPYDLALSKLERNIQRDRDDVKHLATAVPLDLEVLRNRYQKELRWQLGNPEREDLTLKLWIEMIEEVRTKRTDSE